MTEEQRLQIAKQAALLANDNYGKICYQIQAKSEQIKQLNSDIVELEVKKEDAYQQVISCGRTLEKIKQDQLEKIKEDQKDE